MIYTMQQEQAAAWFKKLRNDICQRFEQLEQRYSSSDACDIGAFNYTTWQRQQHGVDGDFGGGTMGIMRGRVFEKVGVNISVVHGQFDDEFIPNIPGAEESNGQFWAAGISLVAHMHSPKVPAIHMNTRMICTSKTWFGGGTDLNSACPDPNVTAAFHQALKVTLDKHNPAYYDEYKAWCDKYFYIPHRQKSRGQGGIFYDNLASGSWQDDFDFTQDVGRCFLDIYPQLVEQKIHDPYDDADKEALYAHRGLYAEFNLLYDRGTKFGLMTGGNSEAILMSLPPMATWR